MDFNEQEKKYTQVFSKVILNESILNGSISLIDFLNKKKLADPDKTIENLRNIVEAKIYATVYYYALVQYRHMELSGNWTEAGADRVKSAYMYVMLDKLLEKDFDSSDYNKFEEMIEKEVSRYNLSDLNVEQLKKIIDYPEIVLFDKKFRHTQTKEINRILEVVHSVRRIIMGASGENKSIIFGIASHIKYQKYDLYYMKKEDIRTPNCVHYIVAVIEDDQIVVREEVCKYIFEKKWMPVSGQDMFIFSFMSSTPENSIAESIKKKTVGFFQEKGLRESSDDFISLMKENFAWHELAHDALEDTDISHMELAIVDGLTAVKENVLSVMQEVMVEWYPENGGIKGPLKNIIDIAMKQDTVKADKMLYMYMSDAWFLDTDTEFMYPYTYIMFSALQQFIEKDSSIDYARMYVEAGKVYKFLADWYKNTLSDLYVKLKGIVFSEKGKQKNFAELEKEIMDMMSLYETKVLNKERDEKEKIGSFWINFFTQLKIRDRKALDPIFSYLVAREKELYESLKTMFINAEKGEYSNKDIRECIFIEMQKKGFSIEL